MRRHCAEAHGSWDASGGGFMTPVSSPRKTIIALVRSAECDVRENSVEVYDDRLVVACWGLPLLSKGSMTRFGASSFHRWLVGVFGRMCAVERARLFEGGPAFVLMP